MQHAIAALQARAPVQVIGPEGCADHLQAEVLAALPFVISRFLPQAAYVVAKQARFGRYRAVFAGNGLVAPLAWLAAKRAGCPVVVFVHGLDLTYPHPLYQALFMRALRFSDLVVANSHYTAGLAKQKGIERVTVLHPGAAVDLPPPDTEAFLKQQRLNPGFLLSVGRLTPRKGVAHFIQHILPKLIETQPDLHYVVVGEAPQAEAALGYEASIQQAIQQAGLQDRVHLLGGLPDAALQAAFASASVHVFAVQDLPNDAEGFGMVAIEAAAQGLPTVAFRVAGVPDAVAEGASGSLVASDKAFAQAVLRWLDKQKTHPALVKAACKAHAAGFSWENYGQRLWGLVESL